MLTLYTADGGVPLHEDDYYIRELASGLDELIFTMSIWDAEYPLVQEEASIREHSNDDAPINYLVKAIDGGSERATVKCQIDLDDWKSVMVVGYNSGSASVGEIVNVVKPTGWTVTDHSGMTYKRTIKLDAATAFDVLEQCRSKFNGISFRFDNVAKTVEIVNMTTGENIGAFATRDLNLKRNDYKGKSAGFATRLYAYGKDGLSFADINGGKPYVENHTYSDRVICAYWKDERYTVAANLLLDAQAKIDAMAVPQRSFDLDVVDLAAVDPAKYGYLSFPLFTVVGLIDQTRGAGKVDHRVVERWRYPYLPQKNKVVLSTAAPRIQSQVTQIIQSVTNANSDWSQQQAAYINALTASILGAKGGAVRLLDTDDDGVPDTLYIADDPDPAQAVNVWRFNYQGWAASQNGYNGPFVLGADFTDGGTLYANNLRVTNINGQNILEKTIGTAPIADEAVTAGKVAAYSLGTGQIATNGINNRCIASGSIYTSTCDSTIQGYFADVIETQKLYAGTATVNYLSASFIRGGRYLLENFGSPVRLYYQGSGQPVVAYT
jgi:phage minor structural protein